MKKVIIVMFTILLCFQGCQINTQKQKLSDREKLISYRNKIEELSKTYKFIINNFSIYPLINTSSSIGANINNAFNNDGRAIAEIMFDENAILSLKLNGSYFTSELKQYEYSEQNDIIDKYGDVYIAIINSISPNQLNIEDLESFIGSPQKYDGNEFIKKWGLEDWWSDKVKDSDTIFLCKPYKSDFWLFFDVPDDFSILFYHNGFDDKQGLYYEVLEYDDNCKRDYYEN